MLYLVEKTRYSDAIIHERKIITYKPTTTTAGEHLGLHSMYSGGSHQYTEPGVCCKAPFQTWGSADIGRFNAVPDTVLRLHKTCGFVRRDSSDNDEDVMEMIDDNVAFRKGPGAPIIYVQSSASSYSGNTVSCTATTKTVMFHTHSNAGNYWLVLPPKADTVDGMRIEVLGGHSSSSSSYAYIKVDPDDYSTFPLHGLYENSTNLINNYIAMPLQQTKYVCIYDDSKTKWWIFGNSTA